MLTPADVAQVKALGVANLVDLRSDEERLFAPTKLDGIASGVEDIRAEMRSMRERLNGISERLSAVESSDRSAHRRIERMEGKR